MLNKFIWLLAASAVAAVTPFMMQAQQSEPQAAYQMPQASKALLTDLVKVNGQQLVAVGERGHILLSQDGQSWTQAQVPVQSNLSSVYFINPQQGWAVGHDATILVTADGGVSWQLQHYSPETDKPLFDIYFADAQKGIAVGAYGIFYRTDDGGNSWHKHFHEELLLEEEREYLAELKETDPESYQIETEALLPHFNRLYADGNALYMIGEAGFAAKSINFGDSWQRLDAFYNGSLFDITGTPQMALLAVGLRGHAFISQDQGQHWQQITLNRNATLNSAFSDDNGAVYLVGNAGTLLISRDGAASFTDYSQADGKAIINGLVWHNLLVLVTETGVRTINLSELK
ncbi:WD40/YVTN/BNR-like repeat-containing protein [Rheinheimera pacifica]|uniref:WD40/YVTN/BNR-like repeat-containing protein n=1 Tax=Rheinheimera pacifica TaxID=173990 RepID=UPI002ED9A087